MTEPTWICPQQPFGHQWIVRPFPGPITPHCELCGTPQDRRTS